MVANGFLKVNVFHYFMSPLSVVLEQQWRAEDGPPPATTDDVPSGKCHSLC